MAGNYKRTGILIGNYAEDVLAYDMVTGGRKEPAKFTATTEAHSRFPDPKRGAKGGPAELARDYEDGRYRASMMSQGGMPSHLLFNHGPKGSEDPEHDDTTRFCTMSSMAFDPSKTATTTEVIADHPPRAVAATMEATVRRGMVSDRQKSLATGLDSRDPRGKSATASAAPLDATRGRFDTSARMQQRVVETRMKIRQKTDADLRASGKLGSTRTAAAARAKAKAEGTASFAASFGHGSIPGLRG